MIVMKFGGTSVANSEAISRTVSIIDGRLDKRPVVVVSALSGVTDKLYALCDSVLRGDKDEALSIFDGLKERHLHVLEELVPEEAERKKSQARIEDLFEELRDLAHAVRILGELTDNTKAKIVSFGERLSSTIVCASMNHCGIKTALVDARDMIITKGDNLKGEPVFEELDLLVPQIINDAFVGKDAVITQGFIASKDDGEAAILGRGGSDYSASLIGMALHADAIEIWTDVDGVKTADPRRVPETMRIEKISFEEAAEMAHFGAKVLHPLSIEPAVMRNIPVYVLNSMNPSCPGTAILQNDQIEEGVKSLSFKERIIQMNIYSPKMINVSGFLSQVFTIFAQENVSVDLISTSEANITVTLDDNQKIDRCVERLSQIAEVSIDNTKSQVSIIGKNVVNQRGLLRWAIASLHNVNISMISQDASSVNISFVIEREQLNDVLLELHRILFEF